MFKKSLILFMISAAIASTLLFSVPFGTTRAAVHSSSDVSATSARSPKSAHYAVRPQAQPPFDCKLANRNVRWRDPDTNYLYMCICRDQVMGGIKVNVCAWRLISPSQPFPTWINVNSGQCLGVYAGSQQEGTSVIQWPCNGNLDQEWGMPVSPKYGAPNLSIVNANSNQCMGPYGGSTQAAGITQWGCNGHPDQAWIWSWTGKYYNGWPTFNIINMNSSMCMGINEGTKAPGGSTIQWRCNGNLDQEWY